MGDVPLIKRMVFLRQASSLPLCNDDPPWGKLAALKEAAMPK